MDNNYLFELQLEKYQTSQSTNSQMFASKHFRSILQNESDSQILPLHF